MCRVVLVLCCLAMGFTGCKDTKNMDEQVVNDIKALTIEEFESVARVYIESTRKDVESDVNELSDILSISMKNDIMHRCEEFKKDKEQYESISKDRLVELLGDLHEKEEADVVPDGDIKVDSTEKDIITYDKEYLDFLARKEAYIEAERGSSIITKDFYDVHFDEERIVYYVELDNGEVRYLYSIKYKGYDIDPIVGINQTIVLREGRSGIVMAFDDMGNNYALRLDVNEQGKIHRISDGMK